MKAFFHNSEAMNLNILKSLLIFCLGVGIYSMLKTETVISMATASIKSLVILINILSLLFIVFSFKSKRVNQYKDHFNDLY